MAKHVPPPPEPEPIWLHGKPSRIRATILMGLFTVYMAAIVGFMVWSWLHARP